MSQEKTIIDKLKKDGYVNRNWCLDRYISRLSAIICDLTKKGWVFKTERQGGDYYYILIHTPVKNLTSETREAFKKAEAKKSNQGKLI